jgi:hypothetical protein
MKITFAGVLADAWALLRRDAGLLLRVVPPFLFLPAYALTLFVPPMPMPEQAIADAQTRAETWTNAVSVWVQGYGLGFFLAYALAYYGLAVIMMLYVDPTRPAVGAAMKRALVLYPRFFLAMMLVSIPAGLGMWVLVIPGLYVLGRTMLTAPALVAEQPIGAWQAIRRSLALTRGQGLSLMGLAAFGYLVGLLAGQPFLLADTALREGGGSNPIAVALVDAAAAAVAMATQLGLALIAICAYRRLAR